jgi:hypothetical protein
VNKPDCIADDDIATTVRPAPAPIVLVVGGPDELIEATRRAASWQSPTIVVETCDAGHVATVATQLRPFALVMGQEVYAFDPDEFAALARDLQTELVVLKVTRVSPGFLDNALRPSLRHAFRRYRSVVESGPVRTR